MVTIAALGVDSVRPATELACRAIWVPIMWDGGGCRIGEARGRWARYARKALAAAEPTLHVLAVRIASAEPHHAGGVPEIIDVKGLVVEVTSEPLP